MFAILNDLQKDNYIGHLKKLYLEVKMTELMLLQVDTFDKARGNDTYKFTTQELDKIQYAKALIEQHIQEPLTVQKLSREVGLNKKKLTTGFKAVFQTTIFEYAKSHRMLEAKGYYLTTNGM